MNCSVDPTTTVAEEGETAIESRVAAFTLKLVDPVTLPKVAVIVASPMPALVASPWLPVVLLITATEVVEELHVAVEVRSCVDWSVNVPATVNCWLCPSAIDGFCGLTAIDSRAAGVTVRSADPLMAPEVARIVSSPLASVLANPEVPAALLTVANVPSEELQCTVPVTSWVLPLL